VCAPGAVGGQGNHEKGGGKTAGDAAGGRTGLGNGGAWDDPISRDEDFDNPYVTGGRELAFPLPLLLHAKSSGSPNPGEGG